MGEHWHYKALDNLVRLRLARAQDFVVFHAVMYQGNVFWFGCLRDLSYRNHNSGGAGLNTRLLGHTCGFEIRFLSNRYILLVDLKET